MKYDVAMGVLNTTYEELSLIADETFNEISKDIVKEINLIRETSISASNDILRRYILNLSVQSFRLSDIKEKATFKSELAESIRKEKYSIKFLESDGTVANKENLANVAISEELVVEKLYEMVSNRTKTLLDECHRVVDALKTVLMTRVNEAKLISGSVE